MKVGRPLIEVSPGTVFGTLTVHEVYAAPRKDGAVRLRCRCTCSCGREVDTQLQYLRQAKYPQCRSCAGKTSQAMRGNTDTSKTPEFAAWAHMKSRCNNPSHPAYKNYGARGITVCGRWAVFDSFFEDMGERPSSKHSLDRIDNSKGYCPENCRWALPCEQSRNQRTNRWLVYGGERLILADWAKRLGVKPTTLWLRLEKGWSVEDTLTVPIRKRSKKGEHYGCN